MGSMQRIVKLLVHISCSPEGITGAELARLSGIPWATVKGDLEVIQRTYPVYSELDGEDAEDNSFLPEVKWFSIQPFEAYLPITLGIQDLFVLLKALDLLGESIERTKIKQKIAAKFGFEEERYYRHVKGNMDPVQPIDVVLFPQLEAAINQCWQVAFNYGTRKAVVDPLGIVFYSRLRHWYLVAREGAIFKTYNMQNLSSLRVISKGFIRPEGFEVKEWISQHWGMEYGEPMNVKVRFANRAHTFDKVKKDTAHRKTKLTSMHNGQALLMEDTIIGFNEFIAWVLGFGSAAEVLEPPELREAVRDRVKSALAVYE